MPNILEERINRLGNEVTSCYRQCFGVEHKTESGAVPRGLLLEGEGEAIGVVVVGMNPGRANNGEMIFMKEHNSYDGIKKFWNSNLSGKHPYYTKTRKLIKRLGFDGNILWSELAKCQNEKGKSLPPQTVGLCAKKFLQREIGLSPADCPIIALSKQAYDYCASQFPERFVLGIPHPTGSHGQFDDLLASKRTKILVEQYISKKRSFFIHNNLLR